METMKRKYEAAMKEKMMSQIEREKVATTTASITFTISTVNTPYPCKQSAILSTSSSGYPITVKIVTTIFYF